METKVCRTCKQDLPREDFYPHKHTRDRLRADCRVCTLAKQHEYLRRKREQQSPQGG